MAKGQRRQGAQRDPKLEAYWRGVLGRFGKSGVSVRGFCRRERLSEPAFYAWRRVIRKRDTERRARGSRPRGARRQLPRQEPAPSFVPVVLRDERADLTTRHIGAEIVVELRCGRVLRLPETIKAERVGELVRAVETVPMPEGEA